MSDRPDETRPDLSSHAAPTSEPEETETVTDPVEEGTGSAPESGVEREDAQQSGELEPHEVDLPAGHVARGSWSRGDHLESVSGYQATRPDAPGVGYAQAPFGGWFDEVAQRMIALVPGSITNVQLHRGEITFFVPRERLTALVRALRDDEALRFEVCMSVSGVHYPERVGEELHAVYHLLSYTHNRRIRLEVGVPDGDPHVPSVVDTYPMANYHERETWDMFGIIFDGHPALTRILMPDDWIGHPQRKDYPLGGIPVEYKGAIVPPPDQRRRFH